MKLDEFEKISNNKHLNNNHISMIMQHSIDEDDILGALDVILNARRTDLAQEIFEEMHYLQNEKIR